MKYYKCRVYTALNADELEVGSKVCVAKNIHALKDMVSTDTAFTLVEIANEDRQDRFVAERLGIDKHPCRAAFTLAYLIEPPKKPPKKLEWTDLKPGDIISLKYSDANVDKSCLVLEIRRETQNESEKNFHVRTADGWLSDFMLGEYTKEQVDK